MYIQIKIVYFHFFHMKYFIDCNTRNKAYERKRKSRSCRQSIQAFAESKFTDWKGEPTYIFYVVEGKEFEDLDIVVSKMKHWAHRLYPKLPFDDVTKQISNLGKKMQIQTNLKKIRMGEDVDPYFDKDVVDKDEDRNMGSDIEQDEKDKDEVERYVLYLFLNVL